MIVLLNRLKAQAWQTKRHDLERIEALYSRSNIMLRLITEKAKRKTKSSYNCFVDFQKAFDSVKQGIIWATLRLYGVGNRLTQIFEDIEKRSKAAIRIGKYLGEWFATKVGAREGDPISPNTFIIYLEKIMDKIQDNGTGILVQGIKNKQSTICLWHRFD